MVPFCLGLAKFFPGQAGKDGGGGEVVIAEKARSEERGTVGWHWLDSMRSPFSSPGLRPLTI